MVNVKGILSSKARNDAMAAPFMEAITAAGFKRVPTKTKGGWPEGRTMRLFKRDAGETLKMFIVPKFGYVHFILQPVYKSEFTSFMECGLRTACGQTTAETLDALQALFANL